MFKLLKLKLFWKGKLWDHSSASANNYTLSVNVFYFNFTTNILNVNKYGQEIEL